MSESKDPPFLDQTAPWELCCRLSLQGCLRFETHSAAVWSCSPGLGLQRAYFVTFLNLRADQN